ncbi:MAG: efflux RND transporter periplasmic adaptor subunit, partial [Bacteroidota bacterium]
RTALEVAEAQYKAAAFNQGQTILRAPAAGQILRRMGEPGEVVGPGTPVLLLSSIGRGQVLRGGLSDVEVVQIQLGDKATISLDAYPGQIFPAKVSEIAAGADPFTGTFEVELALQGNQQALKNGFFGRAEIRPSDSQAMVKIPMTALVEVQGNKARIYLPDSTRTKVRTHDISAYVLRDDYLAVPPSELAGEAWIITEGAAYLKPTSTIHVTDPIAQTE